ncbi:hypothetical protein V490_01431 [Pseudogymnoascus sp. VKM F-3557]|nr:hypothetical protein V490_01431 [Pseudogymnoascus sp. VKM F-3557]
MTPPKTTPKELGNVSSRILLLAPSDEAAITFLKDLTPSAPPPFAEGETLAGKSHVLHIENKFYTADISIWIDIINPDGMRKWADEFSSEEAAVVRASIGAYVVLLERGEGRSGWDKVERVLKEVDRVTSIVEAEAIEEGDSFEEGEPVGEGESVEEEETIDEEKECDAVLLGVLLGCAAGEDDEDFVLGFEIVNAAATGKNEYGEAVGVERVKEALEANSWAGKKLEEDIDVEKLEKELGIGLGEDLEGGFEIGKEEMDEMRKPIFGWGDGDEEGGVEEMAAIMSKVLALREQGADMPEAERKKFAAKAVRDLMKTM